MSILTSIRDFADAVDGVRRIHDTGKYFHDTYANALRKKKAMPISIHAPNDIVVGEPVTIWGTGIGMITLYSDGEKIRQVFPFRDGYWYAREYFGRAGKYILKAEDYYGSAEVEINVR